MKVNLEWLKFLVEKTKERTLDIMKPNLMSFVDPKKVEDWEYECAAALTASCISEYESKGKEFVKEILAGYIAQTNSISERAISKINMLLYILQ